MLKKTILYLTLLAGNKVQRALLRALWRALLLWSSTICLAYGDEVENADKIKTAYLFNLLKFTNWHEGPAPPAGDAFSICLIGEKNSVMALIEKELLNRSIQNRPLLIKHIPKPSLSAPQDELSACQLLYLSPLEPDLLQLQPYANAQHMITVSDGSQFAASGGTVEFQTNKQKNRIIIIINEQTTKAARVSFSAKLLQLAQIIRD